MNWMMNRWFTSSKTLLFFLILVGACKSANEKESRVDILPYYEDASFTPKWYSEDNLPADFHQIPAFELFNQYGEIITEKCMNGKVTVVDFFFTTCPGICPKMTDRMKLVQEAFEGDSDAQILSYSVTPEYDSVSVLMNYASKMGIRSKQWHLLTGERSVIYDLGRNQYFIEEDLGLTKDPNDFIHTENFVLIDQFRRIRGIYNGLNKSSVNQLIADAKTLQTGN